MTWAIDDDTGTTVQVHLLPAGPGSLAGSGEDRVVSARGRPPVDPDSYWLDFSFWVREGSVAPLRSRYLSVVTAFRGKSPVTAVERLDTGSSSAVLVKTPRYRDVLILAPGGFPDVSAELMGELGWIRRQDDAVKSLAVVGTRVASGSVVLEVVAPGPWRVAAVDDSGTRVTLQGEGPVPVELTGQWFRFGNERRSHLLQVVQVEPGADGGVLHLAAPALLAAGEARDFHDGWFRTVTPLPPATRTTPDPAAEDYFSGAWVQGEAGPGYRLTGVTAGGHAVVQLDPAFPVGAAELAREIGSRYRILAFGPGDQVSWQPSGAAAQAADGTWRIDGAQAGARLTSPCSGAGTPAAYWRNSAGAAGELPVVRFQGDCQVTIPAAVSGGGTLWLSIAAR